MNKAHTTVARTVLRGIFLGVLGFFFVSLGVPLPAAAAADPSVEISELTPEVFSGKEDVRLELQVDLPSSAYTSKAPWMVEVSLRSEPFASLERYQAYVAGDGFSGGPLYSQEVLPSSLSSDRDIIITIPADRFPPVDPRTTGSRGIAVEVTGESFRAQGRGAIIIQPRGQSVRTNLNLTVLSPVDASFFAATEVPPKERELGGQADTVESLAEIPGISLAVLPDFFLGLAERSSARELYPALKQHQDAILSHDIELLSLPKEGSDLSLLAATSQEQLLREASSTRVLSSSLSGVSWDRARASLSDRVIFASDDGFTRTALASLAGNVVISPRIWPSSERNPDDSAQGNDLTNTAPITLTSHMVIDVETGLLKPDAVPGSLGTIDVIDQWSAVSSILNEPIGSPAEELDRRQTLRTASLLVGLEDPSDMRTLSTTMTVSRETFGPEMVKRAQALLGEAWVNPVSFSDVVNAPPSTIPREAVSNATPQNDAGLQNTAMQFSQLSQSYARALSVARSTPDGEQLLNPLMSTLLSPTAAGLDSAERQTRIEAASAALSAISDVITVLPVSTMNVVNKATNFPVTVHNSGQVPLFVQISLLPSDSRLQTTKVVKTQVPAGGQQDVTVPVTAVGSGDIEVRVQVTSIDGTVLDNTQVITVRVRANWEDTGTVVALTALTLLFVFGMARTVRKGRRQPQAPPAPVSTPRPPATKGTA